RPPPSTYRCPSPYQYASSTDGSPSARASAPRRSDATLRSPSSTTSPATAPRASRRCTSTATTATGSAATATHSTFLGTSPSGLLVAISFATDTARATSVAPPAHSTGATARRSPPPPRPHPPTTNPTAPHAPLAVQHPRPGAAKGPPRQTLRLKGPEREAVAPAAPQGVGRAGAAQPGPRTGSGHRSELNAGRDDNRRPQQATLKPPGQAARREREDQVREADQVHALHRYADGKQHRVMRSGQERREPGEANEDHHRPQPVRRPLPPRDQPTTDERPAHKQAEQRRWQVRPGRPVPGKPRRAVPGHQPGHRQQRQLRPHPAIVIPKRRPGKPARDLHRCHHRSGSSDRCCVRLAVTTRIPLCPAGPGRALLIPWSHQRQQLTDSARRSA